MDITRRRVLSLAAVAGATYATPGAALAAVSACPVQGNPSGAIPKNTLPLTELVSALAGHDAANRDERIAFDRSPSKTLERYPLSASQWKAFLSMDETEIERAVQAELNDKLGPVAGETVFKGWEKEFQHFAKTWQCDKAYDPVPDCDHPDCRDTAAAGAGAQEPMYSKPKKALRAVKKSSIDGKLYLHGEGFLSGARLVVLDGDSVVHDGTPVVCGTFRCSLVELPNTLQSGKTYTFTVINHFPSDPTVKVPIGPTPLSVP